MTPEELAGQHITPSIVRLSIGTEYIDDIIDDLDQALAKV
ncbi:MAG: PLP-dependent transferase [Parabacteroides merdae]